MSELKKRKIVTADFRVQITKGAKKTVRSLTLMVRGETINEVTKLMYQERDRYHIKKINKELNLSGKDTFKLLRMTIKQEHGYTNSKI